MSPTESDPEPTPQPPDAPAPPPPLATRRRVMYMLVGGCLSGAVLGHDVDGLAGAAVGAVAGAALGGLLGVVLGERYDAWVLKSPWKAAIGGGGLFAAIAALCLLIGLLAKHGWGEWEYALTRVLVAVGIAVVMGGYLALLVLLAGLPVPPPKSLEWVVRIAEQQQAKAPRRAVYDSLRKHRIPHPVASQKANGFHRGLRVEIPLRERQRAQTVVDDLRHLGLAAELVEPALAKEEKPSPSADRL